jgi:hypothetical protein
MTRLALILAAATLGTGCVVVDDDTPCDSTAALDWTLVDANGVARPCGYSGVQFIDVWVNGSPVASFSCVDGSGVVPLAAGTNDVIVEGVDDFGAIVLRDFLPPLDGSGCGHHGTFLTEPTEGRVNVQYALPGPPPSGVCFSPGPSFMWVTVWDDLAGVIAADSTQVPEQFACGSPVSLRLAWGNYTLLDAHEVIPSGPTYAAVARNCGDISLAIGAAQVTDVPVALGNAVSFCP